MRKKRGFGKQLAELHRWNGWITLALAATGVLLAWGPARELLQGGRVVLKELHVYLGLVSGIVLLLYAPLSGRHLKQLRKRPKQKANLWLVIGLSVGWLASGIVLWQFRRLPPGYANAALTVHDLLTWIGVPYLIFHSITRTRWLKQPERRAIRTADDGGKVEVGRSAPSLSEPAVPSPWLNRRQFLKWSVGAALTLAVAPPFLRWLSQSFGSAALAGDGTDSPDPNRMLPPPSPLPESAQVVGGGAKGRFRVYTVTPLPTFDSADWRFTLDGLVERTSVWNWEQFLQLGRTVQVSDFHCVTGWSVYRNTWEGIPLAHLLDRAGVKPEAKYVKFYSGDGVYTDALTLEQARMEDVLVAVLHDGKPIHRDYGGPVRLVVPQMYGYKSVKWLNRIELIREPHIGYWEARGYDNDAWVRA
jgi:DMSO/TMAO reductase YedYZ molybdopterin-dependent catalytic subunit